MESTTGSRGSIEDVFALISAGEIGQAEARCRALLKSDPHDVNLVALLGAICLKQDHQGKAREALEQAIAMAPEFAKPHEDLGALSLRQGKPDEAAERFAHALSIDDTLAGAWLGLASALGQLGREDEAREAHHRFLNVSPTAKCLRQAERLFSNKQFAEAEKICNQLLREEPNNVDVLRMLAQIATEDDRAIIAEGLLKRIIKIQPEEKRGYEELGKFLGQFGRYGEAAGNLEVALKFSPDDVSIKNRLGDYLAILGKPTEALEYYESVLQADRNHTVAIVGRGHMLRVLGRNDDSARAYEAAIAIDPGHGDAWWGLSSLRNYQLDDEQQKELHRQLEKQSTDPLARMCMLFALARGQEDAGDYSAAWQNYAEGNATKRSQVEYDPVATETLHNSVIETCNSEMLSCGAEQSPDGPTPIFIVGMPRSGSTLLEQILASHSQVEGTSELPYISILSESIGGKASAGTLYPEALTEMSERQFEALGKSYLYYSKDARREAKPFFTDKMPVNYQHIGLIHLALPDAKIIDARRHPMDTCVGNFRQLYAHGKNYTYDLFECGEYYLEYMRLMEHWNTVLPGRVLTVQYEDVVSDLEGQTRRLLEHCGLPWEDRCLEFHKTERAVNTVSTDQVRQPIYKGAVGFWKHYESELDELKEILADVLPG